MAKKREEKQPRKVFKKKPCRLCRGKVTSIDYRDADYVSHFITDRGKIISSRLSGNCSKHQRMVANAVKKARLAAVIPFVRITEGLQRKRRRTQ
ncbi:MAG: 30S ribosomal protein S18 [Candidatus Omnitrophota bacterium]|jgi:small subunit ribosomal protein S18